MGNVLESNLLSLAIPSRTHIFKNIFMKFLNVY